MLGTAESVRVENLPNVEAKNTCVLIEGNDPRTCSILVRGSNQFMCEDTIRSLHDALCNVRNSMSENDVFVGGAVEIELHVDIFDRFIPEFFRTKLTEPALTEFQRDRLYQLIDVFQAWVESLLCIPLTLAENAGSMPIQLVQQLIHDHRKTDAAAKYFGTALTDTYGDLFCENDEELMNILDMRSTQAVEMASVKRNTLISATEMACVILKIDYVVRL
jgi:chaperonin GroEL (HSP60 family)